MVDSSTLGALRWSNQLGEQIVTHEVPHLTKVQVGCKYYPGQVYYSTLRSTETKSEGAQFLAGLTQD